MISVATIIEKNKREQIRIEVNEFRGQDLVDIRVYYQDQDSGEWKPSKKGIAFRVELLPEVIEALQALT
ncbi:MAG: transcriptional coactivator p15/PC4 family protein [Bacillota bacterium]